LLEREGKYAWVLDAKAPTENIDSGKNVEQAYSYAIHKEVRVPFYALCNGRKLIVFHVSAGPPVIDKSLQEIGDIWPMVLDIFGCRSAWPQGIRPGFLPDMGLAMAKAGFAQDDNGEKMYHIVTGLRLGTVAKVEDGLYCVTGIYRGEGPFGEFCATFDFGPHALPKFIAELDSDLQEGVRTVLSRQPYQYAFSQSHPPVMTIVGEIGDATHTNRNESYRPFVAEDFVREPMPENPPPAD
jgi:hypothetical protein